MAFELRFSDKEITAWGGMALMKRMLDYLEFDTALSQAGLPIPGSNRGYAPEQLITQFMVSVWCGANRFEHGEVRFPRFFVYQRDILMLPAFPLSVE